MATPTVSTPTVFMVPSGVPLAYPTFAPEQPTTYSAPPPPGPTVYPTPVAPVPPVPTVAAAAPYPVPLPTVPPAATTFVNQSVPPTAYAPVYTAASGVPPPVYSAVPPVVSAPVFPPVPAAVPTQLTDIVAARARIPALAESMKTRFTLFRGDLDPSMALSWIETMEQTFFYMACSEWEKAELAAYHLRDEANA